MTQRVIVELGIKWCTYNTFNISSLLTAFTLTVHNNGFNEFTCACMHVCVCERAACMHARVCVIL